MSASAVALSAKGKAETQILRENINDQLNRLFTQLEDLEELKDEFSPEEYAETKAETLNQLSDFQAFLAQALSGDLTLVDEFGAANLAIQAAVSNAFKTPEVIRLFARRQPEQLRVRLEGLKRDYKVKKMGRAEYVRGAVEVLEALKKMGSELSGEEEELLAKFGEQSGQGQMEDVGEDDDAVNTESFTRRALVTQHAAQQPH